MRSNPLLLAGTEDLPLQTLAKLRAIRQLCQGVFVRKFQNALLALGDAGAHMIETLCEYPDLIAAMDCDRYGVIAAAYAFDRLQQCIDRSGDADGSKSVHCR